VERGRSLIETVLEVRALGGFCIAPHPMAGGFGMKSLSAYSIIKALRNRELAQTLIGIETYNATAIDKVSNHYAHILSEHLKITKLGNSDAHIVQTIGMGMTEFAGQTGTDLLKAIAFWEAGLRIILAVLLPVSQTLPNMEVLCGYPSLSQSSFYLLQQCSKEINNGNTILTHGL
jgi:predicted metal-dependent phosphoesterase TrpH